MTVFNGIWVYSAPKGVMVLTQVCFLQKSYILEKVIEGSMFLNVVLSNIQPLSRMRA